MTAIIALVIFPFLQAAPHPARPLPRANERSIMAAVPDGWRDPRTGCVYHAGTLTPTCPRS